MSSALRHAIKRALAVKNDKGVVEQARTGFYERTDDAFHVLLAAAVLDAGAQPRREAARHWLTAMRRAALEVFNTTYPLPLEDAETALRVVKARGALDAALRGWEAHSAISGMTGRKQWPTPAPPTCGE